MVLDTQDTVLNTVLDTQDSVLHTTQDSVLLITQDMLVLMVQVLMVLDTQVLTVDMESEVSITVDTHNNTNHKPLQFKLQFKIKVMMMKNEKA